MPESGSTLKEYGVEDCGDGTAWKYSRALDRAPQRRAGHQSAWPPPPLDPVELRRIETALRAHQGKVSAAARAMGIHCTQLRWLLVRYGLDPRRFGDRQALDSD